MKVYLVYGLDLDDSCEEPFVKKVFANNVAVFIVSRADLINTQSVFFFIYCFRIITGFDFS